MIGGFILIGAVILAWLGYVIEGAMNQDGRK